MGCLVRQASHITADTPRTPALAAPVSSPAPQTHPPSSRIPPRASPLQLTETSSNSTWQPCDDPAPTLIAACSQVGGEEVPGGIIPMRCRWGGRARACRAVRARALPGGGHAAAWPLHAALATVALCPSRLPPPPCRPPPPSPRVRRRVPAATRPPSILLLPCSTCSDAPTLLSTRRWWPA